MKISKILVNIEQNIRTKHTPHPLHDLLTPQVTSLSPCEYAAYVGILIGEVDLYQSMDYSTPECELVATSDILIGALANAVIQHTADDVGRMQDWRNVVDAYYLPFTGAPESIPNLKEWVRVAKHVIKPKGVASNEHKLMLTSMLDYMNEFTDKELKAESAVLYREVEKLPIRFALMLFCATTYSASDEVEWYAGARKMLKETKHIWTHVKTPADELELDGIIEDNLMRVCNPTQLYYLKPKGCINIMLRIIASCILVANTDYEYAMRWVLDMEATSAADWLDRHEQEKFGGVNLDKAYMRFADAFAFSLSDHIKFGYADNYLQFDWHGTRVEQKPAMSSGKPSAVAKVLTPKVSLGVTVGWGEGDSHFEFCVIADEEVNVKVEGWSSDTFSINSVSTSAIVYLATEDGWCIQVFRHTPKGIEVDTIALDDVVGIRAPRIVSTVNFDLDLNFAAFKSWCRDMGVGKYLI